MRLLKAVVIGLASIWALTSLVLVVIYVLSITAPDANPFRSGNFQPLVGSIRRASEQITLALTAIYVVVWLGSRRDEG